MRQQLQLFLRVGKIKMLILLIPLTQPTKQDLKNNVDYETVTLVEKCFSDVAKVGEFSCGSVEMVSGRLQTKE